MATPRLTHLDEAGQARRVNVGGKPVQVRRAIAQARLRCQRETIRMLREQALPKGDALAAARVAGIQAAKQTSQLIPLCHPLALGARLGAGDDLTAVYMTRRWALGTCDRAAVRLHRWLDGTQRGGGGHFKTMV